MRKKSLSMRCARRHAKLRDLPRKRDFLVIEQFFVGPEYNIR